MVVTIVVDPPTRFGSATTSTSMHEMKTSTVYLHTHFHRNVTGPSSISDGNFTV